MPHPAARTNTIAQNLLGLANIEVGAIVFSEIMRQDVVRWELITIALTLFAVLYILGYFLLSPPSKRSPALNNVSESLPSSSPDFSQLTH
jgi:hypothetical protein